ncbi:uncharacterized protein LOC125857670 [Solanum stenotomum]|uniref:uncharacterized protein LOC125857670 n=1 Tax=Solanum stenotomum TaxID=172797 RepID=UPI0020D0FBC2|nr:uncharacterized protein LOC125857670 [Solanum stenotomum]
MAYSNQNSFNKSKSHANSTSIFSQSRRKMSFRRKKLPVVEKKHRQKVSSVKIFRRDGLKGEKLQYLSMKKIKECYWLAVNDILEGHQATDPFEGRFTSFAIPMMGLSFPSFPNHRGI